MLFFWRSSQPLCILHHPAGIHPPPAPSGFPGILQPPLYLLLNLPAQCPEKKHERQNRPLTSYRYVASLVISVSDCQCCQDYSGCQYEPVFNDPLNVLPPICKTCGSPPGKEIPDFYYASLPGHNSRNTKHLCFHPIRFSQVP